jgi:hypothetical protein
VLINMFRVPDTDIRCTVEEGTVAVGMLGEPQLTIGLGEFVSFHNPPHTVELIV